MDLAVEVRPYVFPASEGRVQFVYCTLSTVRCSTCTLNAMLSDGRLMQQQQTVGQEDTARSGRTLISTYLSADYSALPRIMAPSNASWDPLKRNTLSNNFLSLFSLADARSTPISVFASSLPRFSTAQSRASMAADLFSSSRKCRVCYPHIPRNITPVGDGGGGCCCGKYVTLY